MQTNQAASNNEATTLPEISKPRVLNMLNYHPSFNESEKGGGISQTIPEQTLSIRELLQRHQAGIPIDVRTDGMFNEDDDDEIFSNLKTLDLTELRDLRNEMDEAIKKAQKERADYFEQQKLNELEQKFKEKFTKENNTEPVDKTKNPKAE